MKIRKIFLFAALSVSFVPFVFAEKSLTLQASDGLVTIQVPDDVYNIVKDRTDEVNKALKENNIDKSKVTEYGTKINDAYAGIKDKIPTTQPFTVATDSLDEFCEVLRDVIPNSQTQQNVYAEAWIGKLFPGFHFGVGVNAGVTALDITALKEAALALGVDSVSDVNDTLVFPTATADIRLGGLILPFDVGVTAMMIDSSKIDALEKAIDPVAFDFFTLGFDLRYALSKGHGFIPKWSVGAGYYYTKGSVSVSNDDAEAALDFKSSTVMLNTQISYKLLCLVPFVGARALVSKTNVDWSVRANWASILDNDDLVDVVKYGILPQTFGDSTSGTGFYPQVYAGLGLDLLFLNFTVSGSYDFVSKIPSAAVSFRIAW
jgi:hypothetical protein